MSNQENTQTLRTILLADSVLAQMVFEALRHNELLVALGTTHRENSNLNLRQAAQNAGVPILEIAADDLSGDLENRLRELRPDVLLVFTFPYRLPAEILQIANLGSFNIHSGRLPEYRGPQPMFWEIANGETEGAATIHKMDEKFDHGAIVAVQTIPINPEKTYGTHLAQTAFAAMKALEILFGKLLQFGAEIPSQTQDENAAAYYRSPSIENLIVRWEEQTSRQIMSLVKACNPWNQGAWTTIRGINLRLTDVSVYPDGGDLDQLPGTILKLDETHGLIINCRDGQALRAEVISMDEGILPGKFLGNFGINIGEKFTTTGF